MSDLSVQGPEAVATPTLSNLKAHLAATPGLGLRMQDGVVVAVETVQEAVDASWALLLATLDAKGASPAAKPEASR